MLRDEHYKYVHFADSAAWPPLLFDLQVSYGLQPQSLWISPCCSCRPTRVRSTCRPKAVLSCTISQRGRSMLRSPSVCLQLRSLWIIPTAAVSYTARACCGHPRCAVDWPAIVPPPPPLRTRVWLHHNLLRLIFCFHFSKGNFLRLIVFFFHVSRVRAEDARLADEER